MKKTLLLILLPLLALSGCCTTRPITNHKSPITLHEVQHTELERTTFEGDSTTLRLLIECLPDGTPTLRQPEGATPSQLQLWWQLQGNWLNIKATQPPIVVEVPRTTITREVPVEVVRVEHRLATWHKWLIAAAALIVHLEGLALWQRIGRK